MTEATPQAPTEPIVLYDGVCGLCHRFVQHLVKHTAPGALRYAPLQGPTAQSLRSVYATIPADLESVVLIADGQVHLRSRAITRVARYMPWPWRWPTLFRWVPAMLGDIVYGLVARVRYRVFGRYESCRLPTEDDVAHFLP